MLRLGGTFELYFQSQPFETEEEFFSLIGQILRAPSFLTIQKHHVERVKEQRHADTNRISGS